MSQLTPMFLHNSGLNKLLLNYVKYAFNGSNAKWQHHHPLHIFFPARMSKLDHLNVFLTDWFSKTLKHNAVFEILVELKIP